MNGDEGNSARGTRAPQGWQAEGTLVASLELQGQRLPQSGRVSTFAALARGARSSATATCTHGGGGNQPPPLYAPPSDILQGLPAPGAPPEVRAQVSARPQCRKSAPGACGLGDTAARKGPGFCSPGGQCLPAGSEGNGEEKDALVFKPSVLL